MTIKSIARALGTLVVIAAAAGGVLFTLDDRADRANLEKAQAQLVRDQAALADLERQLRRNQELAARNFISQSAADSVASQVDAQRAAVRADDAAIQSSQVAMSYNVIKAPAAGRAGGIAVFAGSLVQPTTPLVTITQLDPISVSFPVPEGNLQGLLTAQRSGKVSVVASVAGSGKPLNGTLNFIDNNVDAQIGTVKAKAVFDNKDLALWPGQYVTARVTLKILKDVVVVPQAAIVTNTLGRSCCGRAGARNTNRYNSDVALTPAAAERCHDSIAPNQG